MKVWERLQELAEATETEAQALRIAVAKLQADERNRAQANGHKVITRAAALRRQVKGSAGPGKPANKSTTSFAVVLGVLSPNKPMTRAELDARLHTKTPRALNAVLGNMTRFGYAKLTDGGYVATGKEWVRK